MKKKVFEKYGLIFMIFIVGSFLGFAHETILAMIKGQYVLRKGLIYEPLIPIYGIGLLAFYLVYHPLHLEKNKKIQKIGILFIIGFFLGGITEYLCSYFQEKIFGTISWDYSYLKYHLNGRTSFIHASFWAIMGVLFYEFLLPLLEKLEKHLQHKWIKIGIVFLSVILLVDVLVSSSACLRQVKRSKGIKAINKIEKLLDQYYPDEYLKKIYNNAFLPKKEK